MKLKEITNYLETIAPLSLQESYDNAGLITGSPNMEVTAALLTLDTTEAVVDEAIEKGANLIISHHPIIFKGLKKITGKNFVERTIIKAIKNDIAIYASHTNFDNAQHGLNSILCKKLGLTNCKPLEEMSGILKKLVTFSPTKNADEIREALFNAGAGHIGNYSNCSYNTEGIGTFKASKNSNPYIGKIGEKHFEDETRIETVFPSFLQGEILKALYKTHPYEEPAYDIYNIENKYQLAGAGKIGELENEENEIDFLHKIKLIFNVSSIKYTKLKGKKIKRVAICGGSGSFLLRNAISKGADIFISGDFKYHDFFEADNQIVIADIGHYETEVYTKELFYRILKEKFNNFACFFSETSTNPIKYL